MSKQGVTVETFKGICGFCKEEIDKSQMTRHLKSCKQRSATFVSADDDPQKQKTALFHFLVEGTYNPQYWMHIEASASEPLQTLDSFLRRTWVECCDHLSAFKIGDAIYESVPQYMFSEEEDGEAEVGKRDYELEGMVDGEDVAKSIVPLFAGFEEPAWLAEIRKLWPIDDFVAFARAQLKIVKKDRVRGFDHKDTSLDARMVYRSFMLQKDVLEQLIDEFEDSSLDVPLKKVVKDRKKFLYEYDFGSTTYINLKLVGEREGLVRARKNPVQILARNVVPVFACIVCGKPAKKVMGGYYDVEEYTYCTSCAKKSDDYEMMLPIVNSPRVGVCGYTG